MRDFLAIVVLFALGLTTTLVIFSQQSTGLPSWVPVLGHDTFELRAEFTTAQAVTPGQGQAIDISGIQVGRVQSVDLVDEHAVVTMDVEKKYADLIHTDSTLLLRPKTGLNDIVVEVDPGTADAPLVSEGDTIPLAQTLPNVGPDEFLATLDGDTRDYLKLLLQGGGQGLGGHGKQLSAGLRRFEPTTRALAKIGGALQTRRDEIARVIHNFRLVNEALGRKDTQLASFVDSSNAVLGAFADQQQAIREALRQLPPTLQATRAALGSASVLSAQLSRSLPALIPSAQALGPALDSTERLFRQTTPPIRDQIRPFTRQIRPTVRHLNQTATPLKNTARGLKGGFGDLNQALNAVTFDPKGAATSVLFYLAWLNHDLNSLYLTQDSGGPLRRGVVLASCGTATLSVSIVLNRPFLKTLQEATRFPTPSEACS